MTEISFLTGELIFTAVWLLCRAAVWRRQGRIELRREALLLLMYSNLAIILRFTFYPKALIDGRVQPLVFDAAAAFPFRVNLIPLVHLFDYDSRGSLLWNVIGSTAMFIPSGAVLPAVYRRLDSFWKVVGAAALISLCIELLQLPFAVRASDVDDLILNTLGAALGYGIYAAVRALIRALRG